MCFATLGCCDVAARWFDIYFGTGSLINPATKIKDAGSEQVFVRSASIYPYGSQAVNSSPPAPSLEELWSVRQLPDFRNQTVAVAATAVGGYKGASDFVWQLVRKDDRSPLYISGYDASGAIEAFRLLIDGANPVPFPFFFGNGKAAAVYSGGAFQPYYLREFARDGTTKDTQISDPATLGLAGIVESNYGQVLPGDAFNPTVNLLTHSEIHNVQLAARNCWPRGFGTRDVVDISWTISFDGFRYFVSSVSYTKTHQAIVGDITAGTLYQFASLANSGGSSPPHTSPGVYFTNYTVAAEATKSTFQLGGGPLVVTDLTGDWSNGDASEANYIGVISGWRDGVNDDPQDLLCQDGAIALKIPSGSTTTKISHIKAGTGDKAAAAISLDGGQTHAIKGYSGGGEIWSTSPAVFGSIQESPIPDCDSTWFYVLGKRTPLQVPNCQYPPTKTYQGYLIQQDGSASVPFCAKLPDLPSGKPDGDPSLTTLPNISLFFYDFPQAIQQSAVNFYGGVLGRSLPSFNAQRRTVPPILPYSLPAGAF